MKSVFNKFNLLLVIVLITHTIFGAEIKNFNPNRGNGGSTQGRGNGFAEFANNCKAASQSADLDINNVRTRILNGGDMWWDLNNPKYEIPKVSDANSIRKHSLFAGALWIGGLGRGDGNLRMAAMTYRQRGNDFWPGTLDVNNVSTDASRCESWDRMFKVTREELLRQQNSGNTDIAKGILEWPAYGNPNVPFATGQTTDLAPFFDLDQNGFYDPTQGDYPILDPTRDNDKNLPKDQPDQMIWFVYNDRGNVHSETGGIPIGLEIQTTAFAFQTNDEVNNMTFYRSKVVNRGFEALDKTYFGQWVDADLGNYADDYVGCDVGRSLGYCYNGDDNDEGVLGYGLNPPSIGVDFFEGPLDSAGNQLGMGAFVYYDNNFNPVNGNPNNAIDFYNLIQGNWMNGVCMKFGGNGVNGSICTKYMFDDGTNPATANLPRWTEKSAGNQPADRRFLQSAGPFTLLNGAVNYVTVGVVWARATSGGATGSLGLLKLASDKAQKLFNNKFNLVSGPEPPVVELQELENELVVKMMNSDKTEAYFEDVKNELNQVIEYKFQGYMLYQLKDGTVSNSELENIERARLVFQCDAKDDITNMINLEYDADVSALVPKLKVDGANEGVRRTISIKEDAFAAGSDKTLVNFKTYYYLLLAYGYPSNDPNKLEPVQFLPSRSTVRFSGYPRKTSPESGGSNQQASYGDGPILKQIQGQGNGGQVIEFSKETIDAIIANNKIDEPVYLGGKGPVNIKVVDPLLVPKAEFEFKFIEPFNVRVNPRGTANSRFQDSISAGSYWMLTNLTTNEVVYSEGTIASRIETVQGRISIGGPIKTANSLRDWGLAVEIQQVPAPGRNPYGETTNGFLGYSVTFADENKQWLTAITDVDGDNAIFNWIRSGTSGLSSTFDAYSHDFNADFDPNHTGNDSYDPYEVYEKIWDGRIAPYALTARTLGPKPSGAGAGSILYNPGYSLSGVTDNPLSELASVKIVLTSDVRKWTKCVVVEMGEDPVLTEGAVSKFSPRAANSKKPIFNTSDGKFIKWEVDASETGRSYFPGYAVNMETGERLNIIFGEDSYVPSDNGRDMIWNPTSTISNGTYVSFGGKHFIYVMGSYQGMAARNYRGPTYDEGNEYLQLLNSGSAIDKRRVFSQAMWVIPAFAVRGFKMDNGVPPTDVDITLNMRKPFTKKFTEYGDTTKLPTYTFNTESIYNNINGETGKKSVNLINIVPNPYYAASGYESSAIDTRVKITNLPPKATISIYTLNGTLVRRIKKDDLETFADWDMKNNNRVPIASGFYIIHVDCGDLGEKILKWYGVVRQLDLDTY
ncbi:MAG: hypothetical protein Q8K70_12330 [Bacteroidota bacterium]|nr:hypothetical protein [Bacteroidota bacterium]